MATLAKVIADAFNSYVRTRGAPPDNLEQHIAAAVAAHLAEMAAREPTFDEKTAINKAVEARFIELVEEGKHGHYEALFKLVHEQRAQARAALGEHEGVGVGEVADMLDRVYEAMEGSETSREYSERHGIGSAAILTITDDESADLVADWLRPHIEGKTVVEIGAGIGLLALHMGAIAKRVYCIEANPMWSWTFASLLLNQKPKNVSFLFGAADEFVGAIKGDVAIYCTHSDATGMGLVARQFAPITVDVYGELIAAAPDSYDAFAREARQHSQAVIEALADAPARARRG